MFPFRQTSTTDINGGLTERHFQQLSPALLPSPIELGTMWAEDRQSPEDHWLSSSTNTPEANPETNSPEDRLNSSTRANRESNSRTDTIQANPNPSNINQTYCPRRSNRVGKPPAWLTDYDTGNSSETGRQTLSATVIKSDLIGPDNRVIKSPQSHSGGLLKRYSVKSVDKQSIGLQISHINGTRCGSDKTTTDPTECKRGMIFPNETVHRTPHTTELCEPNSVKEALSNSLWTSAMKEEIAALKLNNTWKLLQRQDWMNVVGSRWVFRIKQKSDGSFERYKTCLVAKGFHQKHGEDCDLTYSPVVKATTIRTIMAIATSRQWELHHLDICNAFLNRNLT